MTITAREKIFLSLTGVSLSVELIILKSCNMQQSYTHSRGNEFVLVIEDSIITQFKMKNDVDLVTNELSTFSSTFFPKSSIHSSMNPFCNRVMFVIIFDTNDLGFADADSNFFEFTNRLTQSALDGDMILSQKKLKKIRANKKRFIVNDEECLARYKDTRITGNNV